MGSMQELEEKRRTLRSGRKRTGCFTAMTTNGKSGRYNQFDKLHSSKRVFLRCTTFCRWNCVEVIEGGSMNKQIETDIGEGQPRSEAETLGKRHYKSSCSRYQRTWKNFHPRKSELIHLAQDCHRFLFFQESKYIKREKQIPRLQNYKRKGDAISTSGLEFKELNHHVRCINRFRHGSYHPGGSLLKESRYVKDPGTNSWKWTPVSRMYDSHSSCICVDSLRHI